MAVVNPPRPDGTLPPPPPRPTSPTILPPTPQPNAPTDPSQPAAETSAASATSTTQSSPPSQSPPTTQPEQPLDQSHPDPTSAETTSSTASPASQPSPTSLAAQLPGNNQQPVLSGFAPLVTGQLIADRYRLTAAVGRERHASRWQATDEVLDRAVLILALDDEATADSVVETTRHSTAATDARFVRVLDAVADAEGFYIISEWVEGQPLSEIVQSGPLTPIESAWVAREIAEALTTIHPLKIYHQRLDPTRILVTTSGDIRIAGLTTAAALNPRPGDDQLSREELEAQDVRDLGRLLYSYETGAWPGPEAVGLPQAPQTDGVYVPPRQLRPASNDSLDRVIDQILSPTPQGDRPPLTTAQQVLTALGQVLGATDSSGELAHRLLWSANSAATADSITVNPTGAAQAKPAVSASVTPATTAAAATTAQAAQTAATDSAAAATKTSATSPPAPTDRRRRWPSSLAKSPTGGARAHSQLSEHRPWAIGFVVLAALIVLTLLTVLVVGLSRRSTEPEPAPASEAVSAVEVWSIDQAWAFDPFGSSHENDEDLDLADDGDPATAWLTETYPGPTFTDAVGRPKAGVGWVADLGQVRELNTIQLLLANSPSPVTIYVAADPNREAPALTGLDGWMAVAEDNGLTDPDSRTRTINLTAMGRFVLVFFHGQLPPTSDGSYQTGIAEITVGR